MIFSYIFQIIKTITQYNHCTFPPYCDVYTICLYYTLIRVALGLIWKDIVDQNIRNSSALTQGRLILAIESKGLKLSMEN